MKIFRFSGNLLNTAGYISRHFRLLSELNGHLAQAAEGHKQAKHNAHARMVKLGMWNDEAMNVNKLGDGLSPNNLRGKSKQYRRYALLGNIVTPFVLLLLPLTFIVDLIDTVIRGIAFIGAKFISLFKPEPKVHIHQAHRTSHDSSPKEKNEEIGYKNLRRKGSQHFQFSQWGNINKTTKNETPKPPSPPPSPKHKG